MKEYFINLELKISSAILILIMTLFLFIVLFTLNLYNNNLKDNYIKSIGAISARIVEKNPELEKEIVPLITKEISEEEVIKGKTLLRNYGLTESLEIELYPYISTTSKKNNYSTFYIFILMTAVLFIFNYLQYVFLYGKIRILTLAARRVADGHYDINISENKEGDFSKLAVSFNSMKEVIRNNLSELKKEKQFLVDLLSDISHQLKTPLSSMILYNDIMLNKELSVKQRNDFLLNNENQLHRMNWLIQSILKLAKLDAKAIGLVKEKQSLNETIEESIETLESKAVQGRIKINFKENKEVIFEHDRLWFEEAIINIIKNGIEHTQEEGEINIHLIENPIYKKIVIEDNGEGIKEMDLPNIFKRFYKAKTSRKRESVGIGLALAKSIVELHNGFIEVHSEVGVGTEFIITFLKY